MRQFWRAYMRMVAADPGQDPRGGPDLQNLWHVLDMTPEVGVGNGNLGGLKVATTLGLIR